jgi:L-asparaginase
MQPRIAIIGMGGSISTLGRHKLDLYEYGQFAKPLQVEDVLAMFSDVLVGFDVVPVPFRAVDSATADPALWLELSALISRVAADDSIAGIVILHGTSTLEETAYFLHLTVKVATPIVLVGAQRPPNGLGSDAGINLVNALRVAAAREARGLGVLVVMNDEVQSAREVAKTSNFRLQAFETPDFGVLGNVDPDGTVAIYRLPARRHAPDTEFDVRDFQQLPSVEIVYSYAGASALAIDAFVDAGVKGIVVAGMPPGRASPAQRVALIVAAKRGVLVVQCSRAGSGRVIQRSEDREAGFVTADNLNPQKARVLAMLALCCTNDRAAITRMFNEY